MRRRARITFLLLLTTWLVAGALYALLAVRAGRRTQQGSENRWEDEGDVSLTSESQVETDRAAGDLPDPRHSRCFRYDDWMPSSGTVSVVVSFYNEEAGPLARTVHSVLRRTPEAILEEIILVDDFSSDAQMAWEKLWPTSPSHCEVNAGWVQPLFHALEQNRHALVSPVIDVIDPQTLEYRASSSNLKGGFDWSLRFRWLPLGDEERKNKPVEVPFRTPVTPGGLFMIRKDWFLELGGFDPGLDIWGTENFEMSVKGWLCGGEVLTSRCSRVGHVFRPQHPYPYPAETHAHNARRVVDVWFDGHRTHFYDGQTDLGPNTSPGNLTSRLVLKGRLSCKPFRWFLENVYPELRVPAVRQISAAGQLRRGESCLDAEGSKLALTSCLLDRATQSWSLTEEGQLVSGLGGHCLVADHKGVLALQDKCLGALDHTKVWVRRRRALRHRVTGLCLSVQDSADGKSGPVLTTCDPAAYGQSWDFTTELQSWT